MDRMLNQKQKFVKECERAILEQASEKHEVAIALKNAGKNEEADAVVNDMKKWLEEKVEKELEPLMKMDKKTMVHLIELVDDLTGLDDALKNLTGMGYHERFPRLAYVYDVIKQESIFHHTDDDDEMAGFFDLVEDSSMTPEERAEKLMGVED